MFPNAPVLVARFLDGVTVSNPGPPPVGRPGLLVHVMGESASASAVSRLLLCDCSSCGRIGAVLGGDMALLESIVMSGLPLLKLVA